MRFPCRIWFESSVPTGSGAFEEVPRAAVEHPVVQPSCMVPMETYASAHLWGRAIGELGHEVRLISPAYEAVQKRPLMFF
jgi:transposase